MEAVVGQPSSNRGRGRLKLNPRILAITGTVAAVIVIIGGFVGWHNWSVHKDKTAKVDMAIAQSEAAYDKGEFVNALNIVRNMDKQATSKKQKATVYQVAALAAAGANQLSEAAHFYELRHQVDPGSVQGDANTLADIYQRLGNKQKAIEQYKIALEYAKGHKSQYSSDATAIQATIDELEQGQ
jgi:tetratricopeptide (TPR) repeat protein